MCPVPECARVASPDGSHRQRPSRAEDRLSGNRLPAQTCRRPGVPLSESSRFPGTGYGLRPHHRVVRRERGLDQRPRAGGYGRSAAPARADRGRCCPPRRRLAQANASRAADPAAGCPVDARPVVPEPIGDLPGAGMRCLSTLRVIGEGAPPAAPFSPSSRRRPGDRVRAGRLHAVADGPPGVGTFGPDPGPAAE